MTELSTAIEKAKDTPQARVQDLIKRQTPAISKALPQHLNSERFARIVLTEIRRNPKLLNCTPESLLGAVMLSAQLGLEPGPLGHCYLVPYGSEVQWQIGYKGMIDLARRSGQVLSIEAREVCEGDDFDFSYGFEPTLTHRPNLEERGNAYAYYAVAKLKDGGVAFIVLSKEDVDKRMRRSPSAKSSTSPWKTDYDAMARKTAIRALFPFLPIATEAAQAAAIDGVTVNLDEGEAFELESVEAPAEIIEAEIVTDTKPEDIDGWKALAKAKATNTVALLKRAREIADADLSRDVVPESLKDVVGDDELSSALFAWLADK